MVNESGIEAGSEAAFELGHIVGGLIFDAIWPDTDDHPGMGCYIAFVLRNATNERLKDGDSQFEHNGSIYKPRPLPKAIAARKSGVWVVMQDPDGLGTLTGSVWYKIGDGDQVNIDFDNHSEIKPIQYGAYTREKKGKYAVAIYGENKDHAGCEVQLGYDYHDTKIANAALEESPAVAVFSKDKGLYCFHQGVNDNGRIWYTRYSGQSWEVDTRIEEPKGNHPGMQGRASAVEFNGSLYVFYHGRDDNNLWYITFDGQKWSWAQTVPNTQLSASPSAAIWKGRIWIFHQDVGNEGRLFVNTFDGSNWSGDTPYFESNAVMSESPSAIVAQGLLTVFFQGQGQNGKMKYVIHTKEGIVGAMGHSQPLECKGICMSASPTAVVADDGKLRVYHHGNASNGQLWAAVGMGAEDGWGDVPVVGPRVSYSPAAAVYNGLVHVVHHGLGASREMWHVALPFDH